MIDHLRNVWKSLEPWYDWGRFSLIDLVTGNDIDGWHFELNWRGFQILIAFGKRGGSV